MISSVHSNSDCLEILLVVHLAPFNSSGIYETDENGSLVPLPFCYLDFQFPVTQSRIWPLAYLLASFKSTQVK